MEMRSWIAAAVVATALCGAAEAGQITLDVKPSSAPNVFGSSSWNGYLSNALDALENGSTQVGDRNTDPEGYLTTNVMDAGDFMVTSFNSWRGDASPTGAFANELGNRLHFGLHVVGDGTVQFKLTDLEFSITSSDSPNALGFTGDFVGFGYNSSRVGINWGADRVKGGGDDFFATQGDDLIDELIYVGVGNAFWPQPTAGQTNQDAIDETYDYVQQYRPFTVTGSYSILGTDGNRYAGEATVHLVPLPPAAAIGLVPMLLGGAFAAWRRRRESRSDQF